MKAEKYTKEADLCADFIAEVEKRGDWQAYPETQGFDILLANKAIGIQIGIEAKLRPTLKVIAQALPHRFDEGEAGPDFRAVLVPISDADFARICGALGLVVLEFRRERIGDKLNSPIPDLPRFDRPYADYATRHWHDWCPSKRLKLPDYVPDVQAGSSAPVQLSEWKIKAIKLQIILQERPVTRADFRALHLSPSIWLEPGGWLIKRNGGFVPGPRMPDLRAQHPKNFAEIEADKGLWMADLPAFQQVGVEHDLFGDSA